MTWQVIYPQTREEMSRRGRSDSELSRFLDIVQLSYLVASRDAGWDAVEDWMDVLSGGEKQRIAVSTLSTRFASGVLHFYMSHFNDKVLDFINRLNRPITSTTDMTQ